MQREITEYVFHELRNDMNATLGAGMDKDCSSFLGNATVVDAVINAPE